MRRALPLLLLALPAAAADREEVEALVRQLGAPTFRERSDASLRLARMGDGILPLLAEIPADDPEVRRRLHGFLRKTQQLRLRVVAAPESHAIGGPLVLEVHLVNETEDSYSIPLARRPDEGAGTWSVFAVTLDGRERPLSPDQVEILSEVDRWNILEPGGRLRVALRLEGEETGLRRPGETEIAVALVTDNLVRRYGHSVRPEEIHQETLSRRIPADPCRVVAVGRTPAALEAALAGGDPKERASALAEAALRDDPLILPLLRRQAGDPDLRLAAIRRLGAAALEEDLGLLVRAATGDPQRDVRLAAVEALGGFRQAQARSRLILLAHDEELRVAAVRALRRHRHPATVRCFIDLLRNNYRDASWVKEVQDALWEWTEKRVSNDPGEIEAFERWWNEHGRLKDDR